MPDKVTAEQLQIEILKRRYEKLLTQPDVFPNHRNWEFIIANRLCGTIGTLLYRKYLVALFTDEHDQTEYHQLAIEKFPEYLKSLDYVDAAEIVYSDLHTNPEEAIQLIKDNQLFDPDRIYDLVEDREFDIAFEILNAYMPTYTKEDLFSMQELLRLLNTLPDKGQMVRSRNILGQMVDRYICPNNHSNSIDREFCSHSGCGLNIQGLTEEQVEAIKQYANMVNVLKGMLDAPDQYQG